ncbi:MAG TPA: LamG domain-containing protein, partial [Spirochaetota bacterium]|nr:LamG domain-containing protein [Spirochaetota bacterium]
TYDISNNKILYGAGTYWNSFISGAIDEVLVYNKELTLSEIEDYFDKNSYKSNRTFNLLNKIDLSSDKRNFSLTKNKFNNEKTAIKFNGISNYTEMKNEMEETRYGTISTWVKFDDYAFNEEPLKIFFEIVSGKPSKMQSGDWGLALFLHNSTGISFAIYNSKQGQSFANSGFYPLLGKWYNVTATWGKDGMKLYIDGKLKAKTNFIGTFDSYQDKFLIGAGTFPKSFLNGAIDDITIYERVLSPIEIKSIYDEYINKSKKKIEIKKIDFNFNKKNDNISFEVLTKNYRKNMLISGIITGGTGLVFIGLSPLFISFSNYYKKYYNITNYFYENAVSKGEIDYYYDVLKYYAGLNNTFSALSVLSLPIGISLSITSFILFILQNYYIKDNNIIDLNVYFENNQKINLSVGIKL